jgi:hypothetical protein
MFNLTIDLPVVSGQYIAVDGGGATTINAQVTNSVGLGIPGLTITFILVNEEEGHTGTIDNGGGSNTNITDNGGNAIIYYGIPYTYVFGYDYIIATVVDPLTNQIYYSNQITINLTGLEHND